MYAIRSYYGFGAENFPDLDRLRLAAENFEFRISPAMVDLIKSPDDPIWRQYIPSVQELEVHVITSYSIHYTKLYEAMFTFDKLNKDFTSVDKVPLVAEVMPSRYIYEGLIVHQLKHNNFKKHIFDIELKESKSDFKSVFYIPKLEEVRNNFV